MPYPWTPAHHSLIAGLWMAGLTASQIAERIGPDVTRNMIVGKARRLGLASRPSPIKNHAHYWGEAKPKKPKSERRRRIALLSVVATTQTMPKPAPRQIEMRLHPTHKCRWITTDDRPWVFCDSACRDGSSYCPDHHARAYRPKEMQAAE